MIWLLDQPSWGQDEIYGSSLVDASGLVPPFVPDIESTLATTSEVFLSPFINDAHHLGHGHQCHAMLASVPPQWAATASPNILTPTTGVVNNLPSTIDQPPIVPASSHAEPKTRTRREKSSLFTEYAFTPVSSRSPRISIITIL